MPQEEVFHQFLNGSRAGAHVLVLLRRLVPRCCGQGQSHAAKRVAGDLALDMDPATGETGGRGPAAVPSRELPMPACNETAIPIGLSQQSWQVLYDVLPLVHAGGVNCRTQLAIRGMHIRDGMFSNAVGKICSGSLHGNNLAPSPA